MGQEHEDAVIAAIAADPRYEALVRERGRLGWILSALIFFSFVGYLAVIAFDKAALAQPIGDGVTSVGIPVGLGLIVLTIAVTALYVRRANGSYDTRLAEILKDHQA
ncbi:MAG: hypothetical protein JWL96_2306 [Sphingomonas bacterium]|uniref:DUF485 domain-containing protein n=1 Tax=Sphingomonas bacterium TaxID=1895847 RepID=UPI002A58398D|nr:hypothetical protein [Sphingomonas bacterium]